MLESLPMQSTGTVSAEPEGGRRSRHTKIITDVTQIPPGDWSRVYPDVLEGYGFFKTLQESGLDQFEWHYILV